MTSFTKDDTVHTQDGTLATFVAYTSQSNPASAIIRVGADTRVVAAVSLRKAGA